MYLKKLEMQGFKSFADRIELNFNRGISSIVGPNGSGKSNISDAIRWVMGEQSVKSLRGAKMEDVIFAGTQSRKAVGYAQVSLTLGNSSLVLGSNYDEVTITRRVFRSGEGEYYINNSLCRLKDIHEMLMDTGLGRDGYSIIGQGRIDEILSARSEDRRQVFEEAAGISKYRYRKEEAQRKLDATDANLLRIDDIVSEVGEQVEPLRAQSERARRFLDLREELKGLEVNTSLGNLDKLNILAAELSEKYNEVCEQSRQVSDDTQSIDEDIEKAYIEVQECDVRAEECRAAQLEINGNVAGAKSQIEVLRSKIENAEEGVVRLGLELNTLGDKLLKLEGASEGAEADRIAFIEDEKREMGILADAEAALLEIKRAADLDNEKIEKLRREAETDSLDISNMRAMMNSFALQRRALDARVKSAACGVQIQRNADSVQGQSTQSRDLSKVIPSLCDDVTKLSLDLQNKQDLFTSKKSRLGMLNDMERDLEGYSASVKAIMQAGELKGISIRGTVAQLIKVPTRYITAIETALGGATGHIITQTQQDAKAAIEYLKRRNIGRATFLPIDAVRGTEIEDGSLEQCAGFLGIASRLVSSSEEYNDILKNLLGRTIVVDTIDNAITLAGKYHHKYRIVTLEGELLNPGGSMTGGSKNKAAPLFARSNEIGRLQDEIADIESKIADIIGQKVGALDAEYVRAEELLCKREEDVKKRREHIDGLEKSFSGETERRAELERSELEITLRLAGIRKDMQIILERIRNYGEERESVRRGISKAQEEQERLMQLKASFAGEITQKEANIDLLERKLAEFKSELGLALERRHGADERIKQAQQLSRTKQEQILLLGQETSRLENRRVKVEFEIEAIINRLWEEYELTVTEAQRYKCELTSLSKAQKRVAEIKDEIRQLGNINVDSIEEYKKVKERFEFLSAQRADLLAAKENLIKIIHDMQNVMHRQFTTQFEIISSEFVKVFSQLFGGGTAALRIVDPNDILNSGIEIEVQPPGKSLQNMLLLSGGEKALAAIALLLAILRVRPTPFCVLDEIDAALDEGNVAKYSNFLRNFDDKTQFILITHKRGTMEVSDMMYGVAMQEKGVSRLLELSLVGVE